MKFQTEIGPLRRACIMPMYADEKYMPAGVLEVWRNTHG